MAMIFVHRVRHMQALNKLSLKFYAINGVFQTKILDFKFYFFLCYLLF